MNQTRLRNMIHRLKRLGSRSTAGGLTDADLLQRCISHRDQAAFETLVWRHTAAVLGVCRRLLRDAHEADDAAQGAFLALAQKARAIGRRQAVAAWLYTVAYRTALRARSHMSRRAAFTHDLNALPARRAEDPAWRDLRLVLDEEVSRLPQKYRAPFVLCHVEGRSNEAAALELGCLLGTVLSRLARARQRLRTKLTRRGITLGAGTLAAELTREAATAGVPGDLVAKAVCAAAHVAAGQSLVGIVSADTVALTKEVVRAMLLTKVKTVAAVVVGLLLIGGGVLSYRTVAGEPSGLWRDAAALAPVGRAAPADAARLPAQPEQKDPDVRDLQKRLQALEAALAETRRRLEAALVSRAMDEIKDRLATGAGGPKTQAMQKDVLTRLDQMIKELEDKENKVLEPKLKDLHAELKLIRSKQQRVNVRTESYAKQYQGEVVPAPNTGKDPREKEQFETIQRELTALSERQWKISRLLLAIAAQPKPNG